MVVEDLYLKITDHHAWSDRAAGHDAALAQLSPDVSSGTSGRFGMPAPQNGARCQLQFAASAASGR
jgi:hypothetical protein